MILEVELLKNCDFNVREIGPTTKEDGMPIVIEELKLLRAAALVHFGCDFSGQSKDYPQNRSMA